MLDCQYYVAWFVASLMMAGAWVLTKIIQRFGPWQNFFIKFLTEKRARNTSGTINGGRLRRLLCNFCKLIAGVRIVLISVLRPRE
ncbi:hypothetical protein Bxe_A0665 [Paraburkholderia xenovorans LB400]|uniref:Uncharacterized protein n=1 Tax=Paraburkholderia xenovorans (strain LB400) TaxID=266265 RepID=Q13UH0_PARXL|nr:hypothetical protein Bxe_A0665 [Paraburkholderia xenovorans LB400]